jgi:hypothetical protein
VFAEAWGENKCVNMDDFSNKATSIRYSTYLFRDLNPGKYFL